MFDWEKINNATFPDLVTIFSRIGVGLTLAVPNRVVGEKRRKLVSTKIVIGLDGHVSGERALAYGRRLAEQIGACELVVAYVVEWSPYSFQTPEENAERHKRREQEISVAQDRMVEPAVDQLKKAGLSAHGVVRHGDVASTLNAIAEEENADQIVIARSSDGGFAQRVFGSAASNLVMTASVPVTVVS